MSEALLVLADGGVFPGRSIGIDGHADGEVVFDTAMAGYQEMLTDPSFAGQLLVLTYPLIGNYGIDPAAEESGRVQPAGLIVREGAKYASHIRSQQTLSEYLQQHRVVAIEGVDTRAVTRRIRNQGVLPGTITTNETADQALERLRTTFVNYDDVDWAATVTTREAYDWNTDKTGTMKRVALIDAGVKRNIMRSLAARDCAVRVFPNEVTAEEILALKPDGIVISPGPGDPRHLDRMVGEVNALIGRVPVLGICLGHQVIAKVLGAGTFKLPFGHRGGNHPVKDVVTGEITITSQNHGYAVDPDGLSSAAYVSHISLNDQTVEGLALHNEPLLTIQYHSEACPGPLDNAGIFDRFVNMMAGGGDR